MAKRLYIRLLEGYDNIDVVCDKYAIDERGISVLNPQRIHPTADRTTELLHVPRDRLMSVDVVDVPDKEVEDNKDVLGSEYGEGKRESVT